MSFSASRNSGIHFLLLEGSRVVDGVDDDRSLRSTIVNGSQGMVSFLSSRIPDLKLDANVVGFDFDVEERSSDGGWLVMREASVDVSLTDRSLPDATLAKEHHLHQMNIS